MMRTTSAMPAMPMMTAGMGRCFIMSQILGQPHGSMAISGEKRPPMFCTSKYLKLT